MVIHITLSRDTDIENVVKELIVLTITQRIHTLNIVQQHIESLLFAESRFNVKILPLGYLSALIIMKLCSWVYVCYLVV